MTKYTPLSKTPMIMVSHAVGSLMIAGFLVNLQAAEGPPAPRMATVLLDSGTLRLSGVGFGQRPKEGSVFFQPFTETKAGASAAEAGFEITGGSHDGGKRLVVDLDDGVGGGSILHEAPCLSGKVGGESFHHLHSR